MIKFTGFIQSSQLNQQWVLVSFWISPTGQNPPAFPTCHAPEDSIGGDVCVPAACASPDRVSQLDQVFDLQQNFPSYELLGNHGRS